jgi:hypothetical protein
MEYNDVYGNAFDADDWFEEGSNIDWNALYEILYHQGDVSAGSYFAVPIMVGRVLSEDIRIWIPWGLVVAIEETRQKADSLAVPKEIKSAYETALLELVRRGLEIFHEDIDPLLSRCLLALFALHKGFHLTASFALLEEDEQSEMLDR